MATSAALQSCVARPTPRFTSSRKPSTVFPSISLPRQRGSGVMRVRSQAEDQTKEEPTPVSPTPVLPQTPLPTTKPKVSTKFSDVLAFSGPAPELINGRLAMVGFVTALAVEVARGDDLATQLANGGVIWFVGTTVLLSLASLVPLFKGVTAQSKSDGVMTSDAEMWNGRFAMLGLVALAFTEYLKGGPLV